MPDKKRSLQKERKVQMFCRKGITDKKADATITRNKNQKNTDMWSLIYWAHSTSYSPAPIKRSPILGKENAPFGLWSSQMLLFCKHRSVNNSEQKM
jgi:hypothetical protein